MKVNQKTFKAGINFMNFEGAPSKKLRIFDSREKAIADDKSETFLKKYIRDTHRISHILINGIESEIYNVSVEVLLNGEGASQFVEGIKKLQSFIPRADITIAIGEDQKVCIEKLKSLLKPIEGIELTTITPRYPINLEEVLIPEVLGKAYPVGYNSLDIGVVVLNVQDVLQIGFESEDSVTAQHRIIVLGGTAWKENCHVKVAIGTKVSEIINTYINKEVNYRFIVNSLMRNNDASIEKLVIDETISCLIAIPEGNTRKFLSFMRLGQKNHSFSGAFLKSKAAKTCETNIHGEHRPCISCEYCSDVCPKGLLPQLLHRYVEKNIFNERVAELGIFECIECHSCNYVCTSKINLASHLKEGKEKLEAQEISHKKYVLSKCNLIE